jgi:hypothetical protein
MSAMVKEQTNLFFLLDEKPMGHMMIMIGGRREDVYEHVVFRLIIRRSHLR